MATGVNVKMGVSGVAAFKKNISDAKQAVKTLDTQLALTEKEFKANGDAEEYMVKKTAELEAKLEAQKRVVDNAEKALKDMAEKGIDKSSKAYQDMYRTMLQAKGEMLDTESAIDGVAAAGEEAADSVGNMSEKLEDIGKGVSYENVTNGLTAITGALEEAAKKAYKLGSAIVKEVLGVGTWADDINTRSKVLGVEPEELQAMEKTARLIDTDAETIIKARQKLYKNIGSGNKNAASALEALGISTDQKPEDIFWAAGEAIMNLTDETEQEAQANALFGKSWHELIPLFDAGRQQYEEMNASWNVMSKEQLNQLNEMDDEYQKLQIAVEDLKREALANLAEPMRDVLTEVNKILGDISDWMNSEEGQEAIASIVEKIKGALQWIVENKDGLGAALGAIAAGFVAMKAALFGLNVAKTVSGLKGLFSGGAGKAAAEAGSSAAQAAGTGAKTAAGSGLAAKALGATKSFMGAAAPTVGVLAAGLLPAILANNYDEKRVAEKMAGRLSSAQALSGNSAAFLERAAKALGENWHGGNEAEIEKILYGMGNRSDLEKMQLHNLLAGSVTSNGNYTWDELQRLWGGEAMDMGQMRGILEAVTDAYERMTETNENGANSLTKDDILAAVKEGLAETPVNSYLDGELVTAAVSRRLAQDLANRRYVQ